ncbi:MAG: ABC transporter substrate-binding protein [Candidatus Diapherotrites archaeon]|nr:ABC transporter substrate-binding protein [Candidatus Diapherotrites archaeon]
MAVFEINQAGGINGKKMNVLYEDSQTKTEVGLTAFQKLLEVNKIRYAFTSVSGVALAVASLANKNEIVQMDVVSATPAYSTPNDFTFRTGINSYYFGKVLSKLLIDRNIQFVSLFYINSDYGVGYKEAFLNDFQRSFFE